MQFRNDGCGIDNITRNAFTAYLKLRIERKRRDILAKRARRELHEIGTDFDTFDVSGPEECDPAKICGSDPVTWHNDRLVRAFAALDERERYILTARVLEERGFDEIGGVLGMTYKGTASAYYRVIGKLRDMMKE